MSIRMFAVSSLLAVAVAACGQPTGAPGPTETPDYAVVPGPAIVDLTPEQIHQSLTVFDSHLDTPANFSDPSYDILADNPTVMGSVQVDLPKMQRGGLDGGYWVVFTFQGPLTEASYAAAYTHATTRADEIIAVAEAHPEHFELALTVEDGKRIVSEGKRAMYISIENAYPLGTDIANVEVFYDKGVRLIGPVHFRDNQFADSATNLDAPTHGGLSDLGRELVREANRLGMVLDASHASDDALREMMALSTTPVFLSHSGPSEIYQHPRNIDDDLMKAVAANGGVIQVNALGAYLQDLEPSAEYVAAMEALKAEFDGVDRYDMDDETRTRFYTRRAEINAQIPPPYSTFEVFMEHLLHTLEVVGPDHVGVGADWDGGGGVIGMEDVSNLPRVTLALMEAGYTADDLEKIWSGNMMRLLAAAEAAKTAE